MRTHWLLLLPLVLAPCCVQTITIDKRVAPVEISLADMELDDDGHVICQGPIWEPEDLPLGLVEPEHVFVPLNESVWMWSTSMDTPRENLPGEPLWLNAMACLRTDGTYLPEPGVYDLEPLVWLVWSDEAVEPELYEVSVRLTVTD